MLESLRHVPVMIWVGAADELVPVSGPIAQQERLDALGYRYVFDNFTAEHFTFAIHDQYAPVAEFLRQRRVNRNPARVSYVVNPTMDFPGVGTVADSAYWLSGLRRRRRGGPARRGGGGGPAPRGGGRPGRGRAPMLTRCWRWSATVGPCSPG
jgi:hypothetical protein